MNKNLVLAGFVLLLFASTFIMTARAVPFGYTSIEGSTSVPLNLVGTPISVLALTDDPSVNKVIVHWDAPNGSTVFGPDTVLTSTTNTPVATYPGLVAPIFNFVAPSHSPDVVGHWHVILEFYNAAGLVNTDNEDCFIIGPTNNVPEVPILGTIGAIAAMVAAFIYVMKRKTPR